MSGEHLADQSSGDQPVAIALAEAAAEGGVDETPGILPRSSDATLRDRKTYDYPVDAIVAGVRRVQQRSRPLRATPPQGATDDDWRNHGTWE